jgi:hypothetical protein
LFHQASDDQIALAICFLAVSACGLIMNFSRHVGEWTGRVRLHRSSDVARTSHEPAETFERPIRREKAA